MARRSDSFNKEDVVVGYVSDETWHRIVEVCDSVPADHLKRTIGMDGGVSGRQAMKTQPWPALGVVCRYAFFAQFHVSSRKPPDRQLRPGNIENFSIVAMAGALCWPRVTHSYCYF